MHALDTRFVPASFDAKVWDNIEPLIRDLESRAVHTAAEFERWLIDRSELEGVCAEAQAELYIAMTCHTEDKGVQQAYAKFVEEIPPRLKPRAFGLDKRLVEIASRVKPDARRYEVLLRDTRAGVEIFRDENVSIETELAKLGQKFGQITGSMMVNFKGKERTLPEMGAFQESPDRGEREEAWRAVAARRLKERDALDGLLDEMIVRRDRVARNAGFKDFVGYTFKSKLRFDYGPADCFQFHQSIEKIVGPFNERVQARRQKAMGLSSLRPWDVGVDPKGRPALKPFDGGRDLFEKTARCFAGLDSRLDAMFRRLGEGMGPEREFRTPLMDLDSRRGKAPGGYQYMRDRTRRPFIFMNAAGLHRDVETMVHEAGHAFHSMLSVEEPLLHYRSPAMEFAEVASMAMELLTMPHWGGPKGFYPNESDWARAKREELEGSVGMLGWIATIDAFQHWMYSNPAHTRAQRDAHWLELDARFGSSGRYRLDWTGIEPGVRQAWWQRQSHLFTVPFYYIEYGIAQVGALQLWAKALKEGPSKAIDAYVQGLTLGNSRPLPQLFEACGIRFDFSPSTIGPLVELVERELERLKD
jgi:oligoendopeptidase F